MKSNLSQGIPTPASPRWCATCQDFGDHHTDRHEAAEPSSGTHHATEKPGAAQSANSLHASDGQPPAPGRSDSLTVLIVRCSICELVAIYDADIRDALWPDFLRGAVRPRGGRRARGVRPQEAKPMTDQRVLTPIDLQGRPPGYLGRVNSRGSSMVDPPETLRVALHRDTLGIYRILGPDETPQASLWRVERYRNTGRTTGWKGAAVYEWEASEK